MRRPDIALIGLARSGKDTIADYLVREHGYQRVAFADPLKDMALRIDPLIDGYTHADGENVQIRLSEVVERPGWERAKATYPKVRRFLQDLGVAVRAAQPDFWLSRGLDAIQAAGGDTPVVVTDCRFVNEAKALEALGFLIASVTRPSLLVSGQRDPHISENELRDYPTDRAICNAGTIADLEDDVRRYLLSD
ncbi:hypothetical protein [Streptomyces sp. NPDC007063]|uniref:deoxynucleotide monophosphate kinase family protein n=1 Tax=Streptomyces sp. NPDC007063 TaxID=3364772 RepID=UPI0036BD4993